ncbi:hypothetical protein CN171_32050, partial [Sinorhizobium meliloti]
ERPPRSSWRICANARSALLFTRQCCTWIRFSRTRTASDRASWPLRAEANARDSAGYVPKWPSGGHLPNSGSRPEST